jgi:uncharacterized protein (DUF4415 family)
MSKLHDKDSMKINMAELQALQEMPDEEIDYSDIPELDVGVWAKEAQRGAFYRPVKQMVTMRLDADLLSYYRSKGKGYQTQINDVLRAVMTAELMRSERPGAKRPAPSVMAGTMKKSEASRSALSGRFIAADKSGTELKIRSVRHGHGKASKLKSA